MYRERDHSRCESGVVRGEGWRGRVNIEGKYASRPPIVSDLPRLLARHVLGPYRSNSGGTATGLATGAASGSVAGEGWLTGLAGVVAVGVAGPQSVSLPSSLSESWPPPAAPCPMVLACHLAQEQRGRHRLESSTTPIKNPAAEQRPGAGLLLYPSPSRAREGRSCLLSRALCGARRGGVLL